MSFEVKSFVESPTYEQLVKLRKIELVSVAQNLGIRVKQSDRKRQVLQYIAEYFVKEEMFAHTVLDRFEQEMPVGPKETESLELKLKYEHEIRKLELDLEKEKMAFEREKMEKEERLEKERMENEARLEFEKLHNEVEIEKINLEKMKLECRGTKDDSKNDNFDVSKNIRLVPPFNEESVEKFFQCFEKVAEGCEWPKQSWSLLLFNGLKGKAQDAYSALSKDECKDYDVVKDAILKAYELVPEAYRQKFRNYRKKDNDTYVEFAHEKEVSFERWCSSKNVDDFDKLQQLILVEEFKRCIRDDIKVYLDEKDANTLHEAATLADDYALTHKPKLFNPKPVNNLYKKDKQNQLESDKKVMAGSSNKGNEITNKRGNRPKFLGLVCHYCKKPGHVMSDCWTLKRKQESNSSSPTLLVSSFSKKKEDSLSSSPNVKMPESLSKNFDFISEDLLPFVSEGSVSLSENDANPVPITILRDTGATQSLLLQDILPFNDESATGESVLVQGIEDNFISVPLHKVILKSDLVSGPVTVGLRPTFPAKGITLLLGNDLAGGKVNPSIHLVSKPSTIDENINAEDENHDLYPACAVTRAMAKKASEDNEDLLQDDFNLSETFMGQLDNIAYHPLSMDSSSSTPKSNSSRCNKTSQESGKFEDLSLSRNQLILEQEKDPDISSLIDKALPEDEIKKVPVGYYVKNNVLMRKWRPYDVPADAEWAVTHQIIVPKVYRSEILRLAHEIPVGGHLGINKTCDKIMRHFFWPGIRRDVSEFCKTCHTCQVVGKPNNVIPVAPLHPIPVADEAFSKIILDCVGPLPKTKSGNQYLLTIMCVTTRFPEAIPLRNIKTRTILKALIKFFTVFGLPKEIQTDQGSNFMSGLFQQNVYELGVKQIRSSAYHPQSQGALERFHCTFKTMLKCYCVNNEKEWDEGVHLLLFAIRSSVQESLGFTPFELVFGHNVRGPLSLIKENWLDEECHLNLLDYVSKFKTRLYEACELAKENLKISQDKTKSWYDCKAKMRTFKAGDKVLVLLPLRGNPLQAKYHGPYEILRKVNDLNYIVKTPDRMKAQQFCHINMLKPYFEKPQVVLSSVSKNAIENECLSENLMSDIDKPVNSKLCNSMILANLDTKLEHLSEKERHELSTLLYKYKEIFPDVPNRTNVLCHDVDVGNANPIKQHAYRVSPVKEAIIEKEIKYMLENNIIRPSHSDWSSPCVIVSKPDGGARFCTDYRKINAMTKTDSFRIPRIDDCIDKIGNAKFVTKCDLLKGYWCVPLTDRARELSAFAISKGLFEYNVMPFGMKNAPATFQRLINKVIQGLEGVVAYIDDLIIFSNTWEDHLYKLEELFKKLVAAKLTMNLSKSDFGKARVVYLGYVVGQGDIAPVEAKVKAIIELPVPSSKKALMRFLGMAGYYRKFCKNFSVVALPLTNLLKKKVDFIWSDACNNAFNNLKAILWSAPVLKAPDFTKEFKLAVDASDYGAGAVLMQCNDDGIELPVCYYSKKFDVHQARYSTIEKELLAIILALSHFEVYINSTNPLVIYTDHNPLIFLHKMKNKNRRLLNWSLQLQEYNLDIKHVKGKDNIIADCLSRV